MKRDYGGVLAGANAAVGGFFRHFPRKPLTSAEMNTCRLVAHRGRVGQEYSNVENTLAAFDAAQQLGVWGIEIDIQWTAENAPVVIHDPHTARIPGCIGMEIGRSPLKELRGLCPVVPTAEDVIGRYGTRMHLMIELKRDTISAAGMRNLATLLNQLEPVEDFHLLALSPEVLAFASMFPVECRLLVSTTDTRKKFQQTLQHEVGGLTGHYLLLNRRMRRELRKRHLKWGTGFIDSTNLLARELRSGAHWIFTENAAMLCSTLQS